MWTIISLTFAFTLVNTLGILLILIKQSKPNKVDAILQKIELPEEYAQTCEHEYEDDGDAMQLVCKYCKQRVDVKPLPIKSMPCAYQDSFSIRSEASPDPNPAPKLFVNKEKTL